MTDKKERKITSNELTKNNVIQSEEEKKKNKQHTEGRTQHMRGKHIKRRTHWKHVQRKHIKKRTKTQMRKEEQI